MAEPTIRDLEEDEESKQIRIDKSVEAGKVAKQIQNSLNIRPGDKFSDIANSIEAKIAELGCEFAFPANISVNDIAAHDTAMLDDARMIGEKDVVKIDIGVHKDGYIADGAISFDLSGEHGKLIETGRQVLESGIAAIKAGVNTSEIGKAIEETSKSNGFKIIDNLSGHGLERYIIHTDPEVPNYAARSGTVLREGDIIAVEPFTTYPDKAAHVIELDRTEIFSIGGFEPTRNQAARDFLNKAFKERKTMPFAERHYVKTPLDKLAVRELLRNGSLVAHPVLKEKTNGAVVQFEHTVLVEKDSARVLF